MIEVIVYVIALFAISAGLLWIAERVSRRIGSRSMLMFLLGLLSLVVSVLYSLYNWEHLAWWQRLVYPFAGPGLAGALLLIAFASFNPVDALLLVGGMLSRVWRWSHWPRSLRARQRSPDR